MGLSLTLLTRRFLLLRRTPLRAGWPVCLLLGLMAFGWGVTPVWGATNPGGPSSPAPSPSPASGLMNSIFQEPQKYLGREVTLAGTLVAEGRGINARFFLRHDSGARLEVSAWTPLELPPPPPGMGRPRVKTMARNVGRRWRLTGHLREQGGKIILQVSSAEELR